MPNKNYIRGRNFEYVVKGDYEEQGYTVVRASGSHSPFDLVALHPTGQTLLIQCKVVKDEAGARAVKKAWEPTFAPAAYNQILAIKIKGQKGYERIYAH